jgi:hypothetical protein
MTQDERQRRNIRLAGLVYAAGRIAWNQSALSQEYINKRICVGVRVIWAGLGLTTRRMRSRTGKRWR